MSTLTSNYAPVFHPGDPVRCAQCTTEKVDALPGGDVVCENGHQGRGIPVFTNRGPDAAAREDRRAAEQGWTITRYGRSPVYVCQPGMCNIQEHSCNAQMTQDECDEYAYDMPITDTCTACGTELELQPDAGWVDPFADSDPDDDSNHCPETVSRLHQPARHITPIPAVGGEY